jgi:steroid delta-isomerase
VWEFHFSTPRIARGAAQLIRGASWLEFDTEGRVTLHRDYWDAAEELYEKLPGIGTLLRWLKTRLAHSSPDASVTTD